MEKRSTRLKFSVSYLAATQLGVAAVAYPFVRPGLAPDSQPTVDIAVVLGLALFSWLLYGAWMRRRWARYPLLVLLAVHFLMGLGDVLELSWTGLVYLSFAAADKVAFDELQRASGLRLPWFLSWLS